MDDATCSIAECPNPAHGAQGWCTTHYSRWRKWGTTDLVPKPEPAERFWSKIKVNPQSGCWEWQGARGPVGYGRTYLNGRTVLSHRAMYELIVGPIPEHLTDIDHLCFNPPCCNPSHLEPVTHRENMRRGNGYAARMARSTHCINGHEWNDVNTYIRPDTLTRQCIACGRERRQRQKAERAAT